MQPSDPLSRLNTLKTGAVAAASGIVLAPQTSTAQTPARTANAGLQPREVVIRTQASGVCYTIRRRPSGHPERGTAPPSRIIAEWASSKKLAPWLGAFGGDRVIIPGTPIHAATLAPLRKAD